MKAKRDDIRAGKKRRLVKDLIEDEAGEGIGDDNDGSV